MGISYNSRVEIKNGNYIFVIILFCLFTDSTLFHNNFIVQLWVFEKPQNTGILPWKAWSLCLGAFLMRCVLVYITTLYTPWRWRIICSENKLKLGPGAWISGGSRCEGQKWCPGGPLTHTPDSVANVSASDVLPLPDNYVHPFLFSSSLDFLSVHVAAD